MRPGEALMGISILSFFITMSMLNARALEIPPSLNDEQTIQFLIPHFNAKTGRTLQNAEIEFWDGTSNLDATLQRQRDQAERDGWLAFTVPVLRGVAVNYTVADVPAGGMQTCLIAVLRHGDLLSGRARQTVLAHELYHCYQFQKIGTTAVRASPRWLIEGGANYVGESTVGGTATMGEGYWLRYLQNPISFLQRDYDGFGLFFHLESKGIDPWQTMEQALADPTENADLRLQHLLSGIDPDVKAAWPMGLARQPSWGADWDAQGKDIPAHTIYPAQHDIVLDPSYRQTFDFGLIKHLLLDTVINTPIRIRIIKATGGLRLVGDGGVLLYETKLSPNESRDFCLGENCGCPGGDDALNLISARGTRQIIFAGVGTEPGQTGEFTIEPVQPHCCPGSSNLDPRFVGTWTIDQPTLLDNFFPPQRHPGSSRTIHGFQTIQIARNGAYQKSTHLNLHESYFINEQLNTFNYSVNGSVSGCLETKPWPTQSSKFYFKLTGVLDTTDTHWLGTAGEAQMPGFYVGEEILLAWGPRSNVNNPNSDQSGYGQWIDNAHFGIRGTDTRKFNRGAGN